MQISEPPCTTAILFIRWTVPNDEGPAGAAVERTISCAEGLTLGRLVEEALRNKNGPLFLQGDPKNWVRPNRAAAGHIKKMEKKHGVGAVALAESAMVVLDGMVCLSEGEWQGLSLAS